VPFPDRANFVAPSRLRLVLDDQCKGHLDLLAMTIAEV